MKPSADEGVPIQVVADPADGRINVTSYGALRADTSYLISIQPLGDLRTAHRAAEWSGPPEGVTDVAFTTAGGPQLLAAIEVIEERVVLVLSEPVPTGDLEAQLRITNRDDVELGATIQGLWEELTYMIDVEVEGWSSTAELIGFGPPVSVRSGFVAGDNLVNWYQGLAACTHAPDVPWIERR